MATDQQDVLPVCGLPGCEKPWLGELPYCTYRHQHQHEHHQTVLAWLQNEVIDSTDHSYVVDGIMRRLEGGDQHVHAKH